MVAEIHLPNEVFDMICNFISRVNQGPLSDLNNSNGSKTSLIKILEIKQVVLRFHKSVRGEPKVVGSFQVRRKSMAVEYRY